MTGPTPSDDQLDRIAARVHERIEARGRRPRQAVTTLVVAALVAGGIGLLAIGQHSGASSSAGGSIASHAASGTSVAVRCHTSPAASSRSVAAAAASGSPADVRAACVAALAADRPTPAAGEQAPAPLVLCRSDGALQAYPPDAHPATLCGRNGLPPIATGLRPHPIGSPVR